MSSSSDKRTEYERYNKTENNAGNNSGQPSSEHDKISDITNNSSPEQTAAYLADMLQELQEMAQKSGHRSLVEMLEFAHREAVWRSQKKPNHSPTHDDDREKLR